MTCCMEVVGLVRFTHLELAEIMCEHYTLLLLPHTYAYDSLRDLPERNETSIQYYAIKAYFK